MDPTVTGFLTIDTALAGDWDAFRDALAHLILPSLVLAVTNLATIARMTRAFMLDALGSEYRHRPGEGPIRRACGLAARLRQYRGAAGDGPGTDLCRLLEGAVLTETVFSWPGIGQYLTGSLLNADMNAVLGATLVIGLTYVLLNLLARPGVSGAGPAGQVAAVRNGSSSANTASGASSCRVWPQSSALPRTSLAFSRQVCSTSYSAPTVPLAPQSASSGASTRWSASAASCSRSMVAAAR